MGKKGYDRFGRNLMFAPLMRWESYREQVVQIRNYARDYETAYNSIRASVERGDSVKEILKELPKTAMKQIQKEKERLDHGKKSAKREKKAYIKAIRKLEKDMEFYLGKVNNMLQYVHSEAKSAEGKKNGFMAILTGITGFGSAAVEKNPFAFVDAGLGLIDDSMELCKLDTLDEFKQYIKNWMEFGQAYKEQDGSKELNFDKLDIATIPEMMKVSYIYVT